MSTTDEQRLRDMLTLCKDWLWQGTHISLRCEAIDRALQGAVSEPSLFETWWQTHGQFCRAGGGDYEKTFAFRAWEAAVSEPAAPVDARDALQDIATYFRRIGDLWEGPDGIGTPGTSLCARIAADAYALSNTLMALGLTKIPALTRQAAAPGRRKSMSTTDEQRLREFLRSL